MAEENKAPPTPGTPEYDAHMIAIAEGKVATVDHNAKPAAPAEGTANVAPSNDNKPQRPEHIPEKFWDAEKGEVRVEEMAKSYAELERVRSTPPKQEPAPQNQAPKVDVAALKSAADAAKAAADAKPEDAALKAAAEEAAQKLASAEAEASKASTPQLNDVMNTAAEEYAKDGKLSDASYEALSKAGMPRERVDEYIEGQVAKAELMKTKVFGEAGGEAEYTKMLAWARAALTKEQADQFDTDVTSGKLATTVAAVRNLKGLYTAAQGTVPATRVEGNGNAPTAGHFKSAAEVTKAMSDPRYSTDPAFRAEVSAKLEESDRLGIDLGYYT